MGDEFMSSQWQRMLLASAVIVISLTGASSAQQSQDPGSPQGTPQQGQGRRGAWGRGASQRQHMDMLARKLNLSDTQRQQFFQISQRTRQQAMTIRNDSSLTAD